MDQMMEECRGDPERTERIMSHGSLKVDFVQQCEIWSLHAGMLKGKLKHRPNLIASLTREATKRDGQPISVLRKALRTRWVNNDRTYH